jgi:hypothetical protein
MSTGWLIILLLWLASRFHSLQVTGYLLIDAFVYQPVCFGVLKHQIAVECPCKISTGRISSTLSSVG